MMITDPIRVGGFTIGRRITRYDSFGDVAPPAAYSRIRRPTHNRHRRSAEQNFPPRGQLVSVDRSAHRARRAWHTRLHGVITAHWQLKSVGDGAPPRPAVFADVAPNLQRKRGVGA